MSSIWDKTIRAFPPLRDNPHAQENAAYLREWLAYLAENPGETAAFDDALDKYARRETEVRAREQQREIVYEGSGYLFIQYAAIYGPKDEHWPVFDKQIVRRQADRGLIFCKWRGWVAKKDWNSWRYDDAAARAAKPSKFEKMAS